MTFTSWERRMAALLSVGIVAFSAAVGAFTAWASIQ